MRIETTRYHNETGAITSVSEDEEMATYIKKCTLLKQRNVQEHVVSSLDFIYLHVSLICIN